MATRKFNRPAEGLERDKDGHRTGLKLQVKVKRRMSDEGFRRWSSYSKKQIAKHRFVHVVFHSTKQAGLPNGVPINIMSDPQLMGRYLIDLFYLADGETYSFHSWTAGRTRTHVKLTKRLFDLEVHNADQHKFTISNDWRLRRYWFRKGKKPERRSQNL